MEKLQKCVGVLCMLLMLVGCQSQSIELKERFLVGGIGIDVKQDTYTVLLLGIDVQSENGEVEYIEGEGKTLHLALTDAAAQTDKKLFFGHCAFVVYGSGESLRRVGELTAQLFSAGILRENTNVLLCETSAGVLLRRQYDSNFSVCGAMESMLDDNSDNRDLRIPMYSVVHAQLAGSPFFLPYICASETEQVSSTGESFYTLRGQRICVFGTEELPLFLSREQSDCVLLMSGRMCSIELLDSNATGEASGVFRLDSPVVCMESDNTGKINVQLIASLRARTTADTNDVRTISTLKLRARILETLENVLLQHNCDLWGLTNQSNPCKELSVYDIQSEDLRTNIHIRTAS